MNCIPLLASSVIAALSMTNVAIPQQDATKAELYRDTKNGYFMFLPPKGWTPQQYSDPRTKVAFNHPRAPGVFIRFIVREAPGETFDAMIRGDKHTADQMKGRGISCQVQESDFHGLKCSEVSAQFPNDAGTMMLWKFLSCGLHFNIQYTAPTKVLFNKHLEEATKSLDTIAVLKVAGIDVGKAKDQQIAGRVRLAKLTTEWVSIEEARQVLTDALKEFPNSSVIESALKELDEERGITAEQKCDRLLEELKSADVQKRRKAVVELANLRDKAAHATPQLIDRLKKDEDFQVRLWAATALGIIKDKSAVKPLVAALKDDGGIVRERGSLQGFEKQVTEREVVHYVRRYAAWALGEIKDPQAVEPLLSVLDDEDTQVIIDAIWALKKIGAPQGWKRVAELVNDQESDVTRAAQGALKAVTNQDFGDNKAKWLKWLEENPIEQHKRSAKRNRDR